MAGYLLAWVVAAVAALLTAVLVFAALRPRRRLGFFAAGLLLAWALTPYRFDGEHWAPAFVVGLFRLFFEDDAAAGPPLVVLAAATVAVLALGCVGLGASALARAWPRRRTRRGRRTGRRTGRIRVRNTVE